MKYFISLSLIVFSIALIIFFIFKLDIKSEHSISAYYNSNGAFAGFIQNKDGLIRACEFSTNGTILSCSKWFNEKLLRQGQNEGLSMEDISHELTFK